MTSGVLASEFSRGYELLEHQIVHDVDGSVVRDLVPTMTKVLRELQGRSASCTYRR